MAVFQIIERLLGRVLGVAYFKKGEQEHKSALDKFSKMMKNSRERIWAVSGEFKNSKIAGKEFADTIKPKILKAKTENKPFEVRLLFSKSIENNGESIKERKEKAIMKIWDENKDVAEIFINDDLNPDMKYLKIYWANKRPEYHFHLSDDDLLLERKHKPTLGREVLIIKNDKKFADKYKKLFEDMTKMNDIVECLDSKEVLNLKPEVL
jgi:hypothetical protein